MTSAEFKKKWARYSGKETAAYQEHFNDLCALLDQPTPATADPTGSESFCFQNPHSRPNSDVLLPWVNSLDILQRPRRFWIVDFGDDMSKETASRYEKVDTR